MIESKLLNTIKKLFVYDYLTIYSEFDLFIVHGKKKCFYDCIHYSWTNENKMNIFLCEIQDKIFWFNLIA